MSEEMMIQQLYDQIDRLISMQNTMLTIVGSLFAIIIGIFAFFQWRINQRDQSVIIKTAKEELIETLIKSYNLLEINENKEVINQLIRRSDHRYEKLNEEIYKIQNKLIDTERMMKTKEISLRYYLLIETHILINVKNGEHIDNEKRDEILELIIEFRDEEKQDDFRKGLSSNLFNLLNVHSKEKLSRDAFDIKS